MAHRDRAAARDLLCDPQDWRPECGNSSDPERGGGVALFLTWGKVRKISSAAPEDEADALTEVKMLLASREYVNDLLNTLRC